MCVRLCFTVALCATCAECVFDDLEHVFKGIDRSTFPRARFTIAIPKLSSVFTGSGDLTAALLLAHAYDNPHSLVTACERAISTVQTVCKRTLEHYHTCELELAAAKAAAASTSTSGSSDVSSSGTGVASDAGRVRSSAGWIIAAAASASGQMGTVIPVFNELRLIQSKRDIERPEVPPHLKAIAYTA